LGWVAEAMRYIVELADKMPHPDDEAIDGLERKLGSAANSAKVLAENSEHRNDLI
jgi:hypothetical protein